MEIEKSQLPSTNLGAVIDVLEEMQDAGIISNYAVGGAVAAILHSEAISTVDLDIFFFLTEPPKDLILSLEKIYDYARQNNFSSFSFRMLGEFRGLRRRHQPRPLVSGQNRHAHSSV